MTFSSINGLVLLITAYPDSAFFSSIAGSDKFALFFSSSFSAKVISALFLFSLFTAWLKPIVPKKSDKKVIVSVFLIVVKYSCSSVLALSG